VPGTFFFPPGKKEMLAEGKMQVSGPMQCSFTLEPNEMEEPSLPTARRKEKGSGKVDAGRPVAPCAPVTVIGKEEKFFPSTLLSKKKKEGKGKRYRGERDNAKTLATVRLGKKRKKGGTRSPNPNPTFLM